MIDELNVTENGGLPLIYLGVGKNERKSRVQLVLKEWILNILANILQNNYQGGQPQRVTISRAVVINPRHFLADEPTSNLDSKNGIEVMNLLCELNKNGATISMVTHSDRDAQYASGSINLFDRQIVSDGLPIVTQL